MVQVAKCRRWNVAAAEPPPRARDETDLKAAFHKHVRTTPKQADPEVTPEVLENWTSRRELAEKWAVLPGEEKADNNVVSECASRLTP